MTGSINIKAAAARLLQKDPRHDAACAAGRERAQAFARSLAGILGASAPSLDMFIGIGSVF